MTRSSKAADISADLLTIFFRDDPLLDGASSHKSKDLVVPNNVALILLPPYSPELNPAEQIWNKLRRDYFANRVFDSLDAATEQAERGLSEMAANKMAMRSLTNWPWISAILKT
jgi:DDE superfamily endonuclease